MHEIYPDKRPSAADPLPLRSSSLPHTPNPTASALHPRTHGPAHAQPAHAQPLPSAHPHAHRRSGANDTGALHGCRAYHDRRGDRPPHHHHGGGHHDSGPNAVAIPPTRRPRGGGDRGRDGAPDDAGRTILGTVIDGSVEIYVVVVLCPHSFFTLAPYYTQRT